MQNNILKINFNDHNLTLELLEQLYFQEIKFFTLGGLLQLLWLTLKLHNRTEHQSIPEIDPLLKCTQKASSILQSTTPSLHMAIFSNHQLGTYILKHLTLMFLQVSDFFKNRKTRNHLIHSNRFNPNFNQHSRSDSEIFSSLSLDRSSFYNEQSFYGYPRNKQNWFLGRVSRAVDKVKGVFGLRQKWNRGKINSGDQSWIESRVTKGRYERQILDSRFVNDTLRDQFEADLKLMGLLWGIEDERVDVLIRESKEYFKEKKFKGIIIKICYFILMKESKMFLVNQTILEEDEVSINSGDSSDDENFHQEKKNTKPQTPTGKSNLTLK